MFGLPFVRVLTLEVRRVREKIMHVRREVVEDFGIKRGEGITGGWEKLHNKEFHNLYYYTCIIREIKSIRMRWKEHVTSMGKTVVEYRALVRKPEEKGDYLEYWA